MLAAQHSKSEPLLWIHLHHVTKLGSLAVLAVGGFGFRLALDLHLHPCVDNSNSSGNIALRCTTLECSGRKLLPVTVSSQPLAEEAQLVLQVRLCE